MEGSEDTGWSDFLGKSPCHAVSPPPRWGKPQPERDRAPVPNPKLRSTYGLWTVEEPGMGCCPGAANGGCVEKSMGGAALGPVWQNCLRCCRPLYRSRRRDEPEAQGWRGSQANTQSSASSRAKGTAQARARRERPWEALRDSAVISWPPSALPAKQGQAEISAGIEHTALSQCGRRPYFSRMCTWIWLQYLCLNSLKNPCQDCFMWQRATLQLSKGIIFLIIYTLYLPIWGWP